MSTDPTIDLQKQITLLESEITSLKNQNTELASKLLMTKETLEIYKQRLFGAKTERFTEDTPSLFNEAELEVETPEENEPPETTTVTYERDKKPGRKPLPSDLPRIDKVIDLTPEQKADLEVSGTLIKIGEEISEKLEIIPQQIHVLKIIRYKYALKSADGFSTVITANDSTPHIIPHGIATASSLAYVLSSKFVDGLPYYRQETIFERLGIELSRQTMSNWQIYLYNNYLVRLIDLMKADLTNSYCIGADETSLTVIQKDGQILDGKGYMWVYRGYQDNRTIQLFDYQANRRGENPDNYLEGYSGYLQTDGYAGYNAVVDSGGLTHMACWAHVRRKFMDVNKDKYNASDASRKIVRLIGKLYDVERVIREKKLHPGAAYALRLKDSEPVLNEIHEWLIANQAKYPPSLNMGKAINYALNQWSGLTVYLQDARLHIDNNLVEGAIRPFVIGRKNWLFAYSPKGATSSAALYSLVETAKCNGREPYAYLREL
ncbi:MAG: hypothetical protein A2015_01225 [Spirochaetes bacterium GWF1_31_7]|nr:MAG: hypothetical protein A2Y30_01125 [Spirochaetes bacterium GWE1_32_154]OHD47919.1 MAG: hypothetical protein A2015_01225 [Spirochaetes bacterium GWF1_31_7]OHD48911.1 MAG: hypothetical protein A2Y29_16940 [Spirochaetes bacterium GWE2_31_10]OHD72764.1 MAG: hypothetical protein A2355_06390 [Spirochaetes bacterium RIFOXYB1_FULL_32_8]HBI38061.1 IS66 family transposase [Spirochaetia bacterium]